jgi:FKBP-type peptidyl-prolyl cis-trans isomerase FkpA
MVVRYRIGKRAIAVEATVCKRRAGRHRRGNNEPVLRFNQGFAVRSVLCAVVVSLFVLPGAFAQQAPLTKPSGLVFQSLVEGKGAAPAASDVVKVHYRGTFADGKEFDSSHKRGEPTEFPLNGVIPCWTEGVQLMKVGGKARLTCPPAIAYGKRGAGGVIPPDATLTFEIELLAVKGK